MMDEADTGTSNHNDIINISDLLNPNRLSSSKKLVDQIRKHGYVLVDVANNQGFEYNDDQGLRNDCDNHHANKDPGDHNIEDLEHIEKKRKDKIKDNKNTENDRIKRKNEQLTIAASWREVFATAFDQSLEVSPYIYLYIYICI
jgi:hypothetical protein